MPARRHALHNHPVARAILAFFGLYLVALLLWAQVIRTYAYAVTFLASKVAAGVTGARFQNLSQEEARIVAAFTVRGTRGGPAVDLEIPVSPSSFTFNVPLTIAILGSLQGFIARRARAYSESALILAGVHFLYVFSLCANYAMIVIADKGLRTVQAPTLFFYQFLWGFTDNMIVRFEPFLLGLYVFLRFRARGDNSA